MHCLSRLLPSLLAFVLVSAAENPFPPRRGQSGPEGRFRNQALQRGRQGHRVAADVRAAVVRAVLALARYRELYDRRRDRGEDHGRDGARGVHPAVALLIMILAPIAAMLFNTPVAILGVGKSVMRPVWDGKQFVPRLILPLSLSWDHRVIDGAAAARFNVYFASLLADFRRIAL